MKNMKIGTKILFGFGIVIILVAVIAVTVIITGSMISSSTEEIAVYNEINGGINGLNNDFYAARLNATRFSIRYSAEVWDDFVTSFEQVNRAAGAGLEIIDANPLLAYQRSNWLDTMTALNAYYSSMDQVRLAYLAAEDAKSALIAIGPEIVVAVSAIYEGQMSGTQSQVLRGDPPEELIIKMARINDSVEITNLVTTMRIDVTRVLENYSAENAATAFASVEALRDRILEYKSILRTEGSIALADNALDILDDYESTIRSFVSVTDSVSDRIASATTQGAAVISSLEEKTVSFQNNLNAAILSAEQASSLSQIIVIIIAAISVLVSVLIAMYIRSAITKPILFISSIASKIAEEGELQFSETETADMRKFSETKDESGQTVANFARLVERLQEVDACLVSIAANDLTVSITPLGTKDDMGNALQSMLLTLNDMFAEINSSSKQVSTGAKQVADGSQSLAQGATEQAATVQQLSSSIGEIAKVTRENAKVADRAANLAKEIMGNAEKGSRQMDEMIQAVKEINDASQSIGKIIKTIDDIAFQTNILALNAAVEAARAGQHGKGFAVVAEEVRNLAAKSAEAAKETGAMIQNSMDKAELGARIAGDTAESLSEIVVGIGESSDLMNNIAVSSEAQTSGVEQINTGIDQVAHVVQQNAATAEQSAAASEEMSAQSTILQELVSQFKTTTSGNRFIGASPKTAPPSAPQDLSLNDNDFGKY